MEKVVIKATKRDVVGKQVRAMRRAGQLPAVIYGRHIEAVNILMDAHVAGNQLAKLTSSSLITLDVDGTEYPVLVREKQRNYIKGNLLHVDFLAVSLTDKLHASVRVEFTGLSLAVKDFGAVLVHVMEQLEVECLPADLPERIVVDISALEHLGDGIHIRDLVVSDKIRILDDVDNMIVVASRPKVEEVVVAAVAAEEVEPVAVAGGAPEVSADHDKKEEEGKDQDKGKGKDKGKEKK
ncbi:MAG: 50S ribosomal protein L25 [Anaerolineales bacterium]|nr:50S ribosomal protein L25 [Anaerolineales bacterium]